MGEDHYDETEKRIMEARMKRNSVWKNVLLLTLGSVFALHLQMANASEDSSEIKTTSGDEECVIKDDQYKRIN